MSVSELGKEAFDVNRGLWRSNQNQEVYPAPHLYAKECKFLLAVKVVAILIMDA